MNKQLLQIQYKILLLTTTSVWMHADCRMDGWIHMCLCAYLRFTCWEGLSCALNTVNAACLRTDCDGEVVHVVRL